MKLRKLLLWTILIDFALYSTWAMWDVGYLGIWEAGFASSGALQILLDLTIACCLIGSWIFQDARARQVNPWPWLVATVFIGTLAPLTYLLLREYSKRLTPKAEFVTAL